MYKLDWKTSTYSGEQGNCVEFARLEDGGTAIRDTKDRTKPPHMFTSDEWNAFILGVKAGECD